MSRATGNNSVCGWAEFEGGTLGESGIIEIESSPNPVKRLQSLAEIMRDEFTDVYDVLVIEDIFGYIAPKTLIHACGIIIGNIRAPDAIQINTKTWQAIANRLGGWEKDDTADAVYMAVAAFALADGYRPKTKNEQEKLAQLQLIAANNNYWGLNDRGYNITEATSRES